MMWASLGHDSSPWLAPHQLSLLPHCAARLCLLNVMGTVPLDAGHTMALVEEITGLTGVDELLLTLWEEEPIRITRAQVPSHSFAALQQAALRAVADMSPGPACSARHSGTLSGSLYTCHIAVCATMTSGYGCSIAPVRETGCTQSRKRRPRLWSSQSC